MEEKNFPSLLADATQGHSKVFYCGVCKWPAPVCKQGWQSFQDKKFSLHVLCFLCASEPRRRMQSILYYSRRGELTFPGTLCNDLRVFRFAQGKRLQTSRDFPPI